MKFSLFKVLIVFIVITTLNGCSKDEKKVNDANSVTPVKQDGSPPLGQWVQDGSTIRVIFTKDKIKFPNEDSECKWLDKSPVKDEKIVGCAFYYIETTSKELLKNKFIDYYIKNIKFIEENKQDWSKDDISKSLKDLKDRHTDNLKIIEKIKNGNFKAITSINEEFAGGDALHDYFYDGSNLYEIIYFFDISGNDGPGFFDIHSYSKK